MEREAPEPEPEPVPEPADETESESPLQRGGSNELCSRCSSCERCAHLTIPTASPASALSPQTPSRVGRPPSSVVLPRSGSLYSDGLGQGELSMTSTRPVPQTQERRREQMETGLRMRDLMENQRSVSSEIDPSQLSATWDDRQIYGPDCDWHTCPVNGPIWGQLDGSTRLKFKKDRAAKEAAAAVAAVESKLMRATSTEEKQAAKAEATARAADEAKRVEQRRQGALFDSALSEPEPEPEGSDDDLNRADSLISDASKSSSVGGPSDFRETIASVLKVADDESNSACMGANGVVLRAQWNGSVKVAIKVARGDPDTIKQEIELFQDMHHPHLVNCYGILEEKVPGCSVRRSIVTERCTTNLRAFLKDHDRWEYFHGEKLTQDDIDLCKYTILQHVSQGLQKLHDMSVLHRDLKCLNIVLDGESGECERCHHSGRWKICDFGEAKIVRTPTLAFGAPEPWRTPVEPGRFQPITAQSLLDQGARHYCWLHPGETAATAAGEPAGRYASTDAQRELRAELESLKSEWEALKARAIKLGLAELVYSDREGNSHRVVVKSNLLENLEKLGLWPTVRDQLIKHNGSMRQIADIPDDIKQRFDHQAWFEYPDDVIDAVMTSVNPFPFGAIVYSFSEDANASDDRDCVFAVMHSSSAEESWAPESTFPEALRPFNVLPAEELDNISPITEHVRLDLETSTYTIRPQKCDRSLWSPQIDCLHSLYSDRSKYPRGVFGHISKPYPVGATTAMDRRRMRIPARALRDEDGEFSDYLHATHFVFAYQLPQWTNEHFTAKQLSDFQMYSGEISLASYGGFIYLNIPEDGSGEHRVVGVNAFSMGEAPAYAGGAIVRVDDNVTAITASPEMWRGSNIGLEADIYAFGIVMWEVLTRRDAWHWIGAANGNRDQVIMNRVSLENLRPKVPDDVSPHFAELICDCLCTDPSNRLSAKEVGSKLRARLEGLRKHMQSQRPIPEKESDELKQKASTTTPRGRTSLALPSLARSQKDPRTIRINDQNQRWSITVRNHENSKHWNRGMYAAGIRSTTLADGSFRVTVNQGYQSDWEETVPGHGDDHTGSLPAATSATPMVPLKIQSFGLMFDDPDSDRSLWPTVARVDQKNKKGEKTLSPMFPQIRPGCKITRINGEPVPATRKDAVSALKARPLSLEFSLPIQANLVKPWPTQEPTLALADHSAIPAWLTAGIEAVATVRKHEHEQAVRAQALAGGLAAIALTKGHEERRLQERLVAAEAEIEALKRELAARPILPEADPGASRR